MRRGPGPAGWADDLVAVEEPLEIRVEGKPVSVTLRTPGHDLELAAGFLLAEGVLEDADDLVAIAHVDDPSRPTGNAVDVRLSPGVPFGRRGLADRDRFAASSCGVCGKSSIDRIFRAVAPLPPAGLPPAERLLALPELLRAAQRLFAQTGGLHAAALVRPDGTLDLVREDIGRHNAVDKIVGRALLDDRLPLHGHLLLLSGRAGFEIVQKAGAAGISCIASIGAPSSLAVELAARLGMGLIGFLGPRRFNVYIAPGDVPPAAAGPTREPLG